MVAQHEVQHDETMLATHQLRVGPPVLSAPPPPPAPADAAALPAEVHVPGGPFTMGTSSEPWALDNERPAHEVDVAGFYLDTTPVTNAAYAEFIADGGYDDPRFWTAEGWAHRQRAGLTAPLFWRWEGEWVRVAFGRTEPIAPDEPVMHVCWYEADAYARWAGRRLPTEAEWEKAARHDPAAGRSRRYPWGDAPWSPELANLGQRHLRPAPAGSYPAGAAPSGARQLIGDVWEWTSSDFRPYPGFVAWPYKEYSEVFFGPEYKVLRGGAFGVSAVACRGTFRNWDYPIRRQIFAGFRTARSAPPTLRAPRRSRLMCRHLAYLGPPATLRSVLIDPPHGLYRQSWAPRRQRHGTVNADGFGIGWYAEGDPVPARYRRGRPIWGDPSLPDLARVTRSAAVLAAVRDARRARPSASRRRPRSRRTSGCSATTGVLDGWPDSAAGARPGRRDAALARGDGRTPRSCGRWSSSGSRPGRRWTRRSPRPSPPSRRAAAAGGSTSWSPTGRRSRPPPGGTRSGTAGRAESVVVASEPGDDQPGWTEVPDRHSLTATAGRGQRAPARSRDPRFHRDCSRPPRPPRPPAPTVSTTPTTTSATKGS